MEKVSLTSSSSQSPSFHPGQNIYPGVCKSCNHPQLFIQEKGPHIGVFCSSCLAWQRWIRRSKAQRYQQAKGNRSVTSSAPIYNKPVESAAPRPYKPVGEAIGPAVVDTSLNPALTLNLDTTQNVVNDAFKLLARVERLEKALAGYDSQLGILVRAILACGVLRGHGAPPEINVSDDDGRLSTLFRLLTEEKGESLGVRGFFSTGVSDRCTIQGIVTRAPINGVSR